MKYLQSLLLTLSIYGLVGFLYIANNAAAHPETLSLPLTHFLPYPREDTAGIISFFVSLTSFFFWDIIKNSKNKQ